MASDYYDIMHVGVEQFSYLKCPSKIRAAMINAGGPRLPLDVIKRRLTRLPCKVEGANIGEPTEADAIDWRMTGLVRPERRKQSSLTAEERVKIANLAKGIPSKPPQPKERVYRYRAPRTNHVGTAYADRLIDRVSDALYIPRKVLLSKSRLKLIVAGRALIVALLRDRNPGVYSYPRIASILHRLDHSTMIHAHEQFENYCKLFPEIAELFAELREAGE